MKSTTNKIKTGLVGVAAALAFLAPSLTFAQETTTYTVKSGDTLSGIAEKYNTTVEKKTIITMIVKMNIVLRVGVATKIQPDRNGRPDHPPPSIVNAR